MHPPCQRFFACRKTVEIVLIKMQRVKFVVIEIIPRLGNGRPENGTGNALPKAL